MWNLERLRRANAQSNRPEHMSITLHRRTQRLNILLGVRPRCRSRGARLRQYTPRNQSISVGCRGVAAVIASVNNFGTPHVYCHSPDATKAGILLASRIPARDSKFA